MTAHPIDTDRLLARIARLEAQSDIRGRAVVMYRDRARKAEARIKAVRDALSYADMGETLVTRSRIRRALDSEG